MCLLCTYSFFLCLPFSCDEILGILKPLNIALNTFLAEGTVLPFQWTQQTNDLAKPSLPSSIRHNTVRWRNTDWTNSGQARRCPIPSSQLGLQPPVLHQEFAKAFNVRFLELEVAQGGVHSLQICALVPQPKDENGQQNSLLPPQGPASTLPYSEICPGLRLSLTVRFWNTCWQLASFGIIIQYTRAAWQILYIGLAREPKSS